MRVGQRDFFREGEGAGAGAGDPPPAGAPPAGGVPGQMGGGAPPPAADAGSPWWHTMGPGPVRDLMATKNYSSTDELANAYWNANKALNGAADVLTIPGVEATEEQKTAYRTQLGIPADIKGYDDSIKLDGINNVNEPLLAFAKQAMFDADVPAAKAQQMIDSWEKFVATQNEAFETDAKAKSDAAIAALRTEVGGEFDTLIDNGKRAVQALGLPDADLAAIEQAAGTAPVMRLLSQLGSRIREGGLNVPPGGGGGGQEFTTPEAAQAEINRLNADATFQEAYTKAEHSQHAEAVRKMAALFATVHQR